MGILWKTKGSFFYDKNVIYNPLTYNPLPYIHIVNIMLKWRYCAMIQVCFGKACRECREKMNISQEKFALSIGMDRTYYSSVEAGKRNIAIQNIKKIADGLGINISELMSKAETFDKE